jgi:hypothetical protein
MKNKDHRMRGIRISKAIEGQKKDGFLEATLTLWMGSILMTQGIEESAGLYANAVFLSSQGI